MFSFLFRISRNSAAGTSLPGHVLQVSVRLDGRVVDLRLVLGVQPEGLREAAVLGGEDLPAWHQRDEVVLGGLAAELRGEGRGGLAGAGQADDEDGGGDAVHRDDLAAGVQRQPAAVVDDVVPHPQAALLGLTEVVRVEHAGDVLAEVDGDDPVVRVAGGRQVRRVDDGRVRRPGGRVVVVPGRVVELLLHAGYVRVRGLHDQARPGAELPVRPDVTVDHHHVGAGDVGVLVSGDAVVLRAGDGLLGGIRRIIDDEGRPRAAGVDLRLDRHVAEFRDL